MATTTTTIQCDRGPFLHPTLPSLPRSLVSTLHIFNYVGRSVTIAISCTARPHDTRSSGLFLYRCCRRVAASICRLLLLEAKKGHAINSAEAQREQLDLINQVRAFAAGGAENPSTWPVAA